MTEQARQAKAAYQREYMREYRAKNKERINKNARAWRKAHPEKTREYEKRYWEKKAAELANNEQA